MSRSMTLLALVLLLIAAAPSTGASGEEMTIRHAISFSADGLRFLPAGPDGLETVRLSGASSSMIPGAPALPVLTLRVALPPGMTATGVRVVDRRHEAIPGTYRIAPAGRPLVVGSAPVTPQPATPDPAIYGSNTTWPSTPVTLAGQADLAGQSFAVVCVHPLSWRPTDGTLRLCTALEFEVFGTGGWCCGDYLPAVVSPAGRRTFEAQLRQMVVNPETVALQSGPPAPHPGRGVPPGSYDYVIVTRESWLDDFQPLADWRSAAGLRSAMVTTEWIYDSGTYIGTPVQQLRSFVEDVHDTWGATHVLLGGDNDLIPTHHRRVTVPDYWTDDIPNDTFYADFDGDFVCEVALGRAPVASAAHISTFVGKVLTYEQNPPSKDYLEMALFLGFDNATPGDGKGEIEKELLRTTHFPAGWELNTEYDSEPGLHKADMLAYLDQGHHLVNHHEHCNWYGIGAGVTSHGEVMEIADANAMSNGERASIVFCIGCWPCDFTYDVSISEAFLRRFGGGAVSFLGNTRYGWGAPASDPVHYTVLQDFLFYESLFDLGMVNMGDSFRWLKNSAYDPVDPYNLNDYCFTQLHLIGDPGMQFWTVNPATVTGVDCPAQISAGSQSFTVTVDHDGALDGFTACLWKGDEVHATGTTDAAGQAAIAIAPASEGTMTITVRRGDVLPWQGSCQVVGGAPQTLSVDISAVPDNGTLPFTSSFWITLANITTENRRVAGRIDVLPAGGGPITNWRAGWTNLGPSEVFSTSWSQHLPALGTLVGINQFTLTGVDVTPPPYNQPPYAASGDTDTADLALTCTAP